MKLVVGAGPLFPMPQQKMGSAYTTAPMVTVSDTLQQSEYATDPELWDILDSSDDEGEAGTEGAEGAGAASGALPPRYELNEDGEYKTAADMRAAYNQLRYAHAQPGVPRASFFPSRPVCGLRGRHVLEHPHDFMRPPKPAKPGSAAAKSQVRELPRRARRLSPRSRRAAAAQPRAGSPAAAAAAAGAAGADEPVDLEAERLSSMEEMLRRMKERTASLDENVGHA